MGEFRMPSLGADMTEGTVLEWLVGPGDQVRRGDLVAVVKTDKADVEVEVFEDGIVDELLVPVGERVEVGTPLATIRVAERESEHRGAVEREPEHRGAAASAPASPSTPTPATAPDAAPAPGPPLAPGPGAKPGTARTTAPGGRPAVSPYARRRAEELGIDVATLRAGVAGRPILAPDVERAAAEGGSAPGGPAAVQAAVTPAAAGSQAEAMRQTIAALMARSKREIPHYYLRTDVELTHTLAWLTERNRDRAPSERILPAALLCKAAARAARLVPELNGFWTDDAFRPAAAVHLGVAISLRGGGLVAPAIHDADQRPLADLMAALRDLTTRTRAGRLRASEMSDPTITVTNLGDRGVPVVYGVIYPPQVAIVGFGRIVERPWTADGQFTARPVVTATLAADHRATDGHLGARFLSAVDDLLHAPEEL